MPTFEYKAINQGGDKVTGIVEASDSEAVLERLEKLDYFPVKIKSKSPSIRSLILLTKKKLKQETLIIFTKQLVTLLNAGVPLLSSLEALNEQAEDEALKEIIQKIYVDIESGMSFSDALHKHPKIFSEMYVNSVNAGEKGGSLDVVLERLGALMEHDLETKLRIKAAMRYPTIVVVSLIVAFFVLMMLVVPKFVDIFERAKIELPLPTKILIVLNSIITNYWYIVVAALVVIGLAVGKYLKTEKGAYQWDKFKITAPIFGSLNLKTAMSRFTRMFETLNSSGLPVLQILDIGAKTVGNIVVGKEIEKAAFGIMQGEGISVPLSQGKIFPPMVIKMIAIGEQSGSLDDMLLNVSKHYDKEVDYALKNLTSMIEPVLTIGLGIIVLFFALAIFLPMWDLTKIAQ